MPFDFGPIAQMSGNIAQMGQQARDTAMQRKTASWGSLMSTLSGLGERKHEKELVKGQQEFEMGKLSQEQQNELERMKVQYEADMNKLEKTTDEAIRAARESGLDQEKIDQREAEVKHAYDVALENIRGDYQVRAAGIGRSGSAKDLNDQMWAQLGGPEGYVSTLLNDYASKINTKIKVIDPNTGEVSWNLSDQDKQDFKTYALGATWMNDDMKATLEAYLDVYMDLLSGRAKEIAPPILPTGPKAAEKAGKAMWDRETIIKDAENTPVGMLSEEDITELEMTRDIMLQEAKATHQQYIGGLVKLMADRIDKRLKKEREGEPYSPRPVPPSPTSSTGEEQRIKTSPQDLKKLGEAIRGLRSK